MFMKLVDFNKRFVTNPITRIMSMPKHILPTNMQLPKNSVIHFCADSDQIVGIDNSYSLLRNNTHPIYIYHDLTLVPKIGTVTSTHIPVNKAIRNYHKTHLNIKPISNLDRTLSNNPAPVVINYSLLPRLYHYSKNNLVIYQEWFNIRATIWDMINQIGGRREQFIRYQLPEVLPTKMELNKHAAQFKLSGIGEFHDVDSLNLLELWRMISPDVDSVVMGISAEAVEHVNLVFVESGTLTIIRLQSLLEWVQLDPTHAVNGFYKFLDNLISLRTPVETEDVAAAANETPTLENHPVDEAIRQRIEENGQIGALSEAEQKGLLKLATRYTTITDPHGSGLTLDKMVVAKEELTVTPTQLLSDSHNIHDKSMLESTLKDLDKNYIEKVLHKDIMQFILMLHPAGVIVKDVKVKVKNTAVTKSETYSVSVQPINGAASTFTFTIPILNPDGSFMSGGVLYRMDKQKGDLPIVKTKANAVALSSYYGKIFVTRNESSSSNFAKWILKEIYVRANDQTNPTLTDLIYGINKVKNVKLPRVYTAICESVNSFTVNNKYRLIFSYNKMNDIFSEATREHLGSLGFTPCGYTIDGSTPLGMDADGDVYLVGDRAELLGSVPFLIDPELNDGPIEYTEFSILNKRIPLILAYSYLYGLDKALDKLKISYTLSPTNVRLAYHPDEFKLKFKDIVYVINIKNKYHRLLVGGFNAIKKDAVRYKGSDFNRQASYSSLLNGLGITNYHLREIKLMWDMFIEPIMKEQLERMHEPTNMHDLMLRASELLLDDHIPDGNFVRYRGYERICGMFYHQLVVAMRAHRVQGSMSNAGVTMNPNAVWLDIVSDQSVALVEQSNPIHNLKEQESYTHAGAGGRSAVTMVKNTRSYSEKDLGVVSEATPDSQKVGVRAYFSANPNIVSLRGNTRLFEHGKDGASSAISTSALLAPAATHDDAKRVNSIHFN